jgi:protein-S-isoprenylcysteine O-methyltransferase Ste14
LRGSRRRSPRAIAAAGTAAFLVLVPGVVAGLIPWLLTGWRVESAPLAVRILGGALILGGAGFLLHAFARFVSEGIGTPAPVAPTERLVVGGVYRHVRNPMYLAVGATITGQALLLGQWGLLAYAAVFFAIVATFVVTYEEPTLERQFGADYDAYRRAVPGWVPRLSPWEGRDRAQQ